MNHRPKHIAEYVALRGVAALLNALPYSAALALGATLAAAGYAVAPKLGAEARRRMRLVFGDRFTEAQLRAFAWQSWRNIVFNAVEAVRFPRLTLPRVLRFHDCRATMEAFREHHAAGAGAVVAVPHMGNWDLAGVVVRLHGMPLFSIAAQQKNPLADGYLMRLRASQGLDTISRGAGTMREVLRRLRRGEMLAIVPDVRMRTPGLAVPFLGGVANLGPGMAHFARHTGAPILVSVCTRPAWNRHRVELKAVVRSDPNLAKDEDIARLTGSVIGVIETAIRQDPGQWFWFNRRWVLDPLVAEEAPPASEPVVPA